MIYTTSFILQKNVDQGVRQHYHDFQNGHNYDYVGRQTDTFESIQNNPEDDDTGLWGRFTSGFRRILNGIRKTFYGETADNKQEESNVISNLAFPVVAVGVPAAGVGIIFQQQITDLLNSLAGTIHYINYSNT